MRQGELDTARARKAELTEQLKPRQPREVDDTGAAAVDPDSAVTTTPADVVFRDRTPSNSERLGWARAYSRFDPTRPPNWGNRAKGCGAWLDAVNALSLDVAKWGTKPEPIGQYNGVLLTASSDGTTMKIAPHHHHERFNTLTVEAGKLTGKVLEDWLHSQHLRSVTERASVRTQTRTNRPGNGPRPDDGFER